MILLSSKKILNLALILTILCSGILAFAWDNVAEKIAVGFPAGSLTRIGNLHRPVSQSSPSKELIVLMIPQLKNDDLPDLAPVAERIDLRLKTSPKERELLSGFYRGTVEGPVLADELFFLFATGYSLEKAHYGPVIFGLNDEKSGDSFLHSAQSKGYYLSLCGTSPFQERFPETGIRREFIDSGTGFNGEASKVLKSSFAASIGKKSFHLMCLEPSFSPLPDTVVSDLLSVALKRADESGALLLVIGPRYGNRPGKNSKHDFFFYGSGVVHKQFETYRKLTIADLVSTISCQLGVAQPSACLGWPIADLLNLYKGSRRLWIVLQISQENERMLPMLVAHRFGRTKYKGVRPFKVGVNTADKESQYIADRRVELGRSSRDEAVVRNVFKYVPYKVLPNDALFIEVMTILFIIGALLLIFIVVFFGPSWISPLFFGIFFNLWLFMGTEYLFVNLPEVPFLLVDGSLFPAELFMLLVPPVLVWSLMGVRYQWNGWESMKAFYIVGAVSLMLRPVMFYLGGGFRVVPPVIDEYLLWAAAVHGRCLILFPFALVIIRALVLFISRSFISGRQVKEVSEN